MHRKILSWILTVAMVLSVFVAIPMMASAADEAKNIYDADILPNGDIAVLYISTGNIFYGVLNPDTNNWSKSKIAVGKDAALAVDGSGFPHVVFITTDDNVGYIHYNGTSWTNAEIIDSIAFGGVDGALSSPDIAVDSNGKAHISYLDAKGGYTGGNDYASYEKEDLIYATNASGSFVKEVRSYSHGWLYSPDGWRNLVYAPTKVTLINDSYCIGVKQYQYDKWMSGQYHTYNYGLFFPATSLSYEIRSASTNSDLGFKLFEMDSDGSTVYSLFNKSGSLYVFAGITEVAAATKTFTASGADLFVTGNSNVYYSGVVSNNLLLYQNGNFKEGITLPSSINTTHTRVATVVSSDKQYILYTDTDAQLWVCDVSTNPGDAALNSFKIPDKTPVTITGVTADNKIYDGNAISSTGTSSAVVTDTGDPAVVSEYTYTWYDVTNNQTLVQAPKDAGSYKLTVSVSETDSTFIGNLEIPFTITKKAITITEVTATDRTYNGMTAVNITGGSLVGVINDDAVSAVVPASGSIADASAGNNKSVTIGEITLTGSGAINYTLTQPTDLKVSILQAPLNLSSVTVTDKQYNGTTDSEITGASFSGLQNSETLELGIDFTALGIFTNPNVGSNKAVNGSVTLADSSKANNYILADGTFTTTASITKATGLTASDPSSINMVKAQIRSYSFDLSTIGLNKADTGSTSFTLSTLTGSELFIVAPSIDMDGRTLNFTSAALVSGTASQIVTISTQNYQDTTATLSFVLVDKTPVTITGVTADNKIYDGNAISSTGTPSAVVTDTGDPAVVSEYTYTWYDVTNNQNLVQAPKDAGSYKLTVSVSETDSTFIGNLEIPFTIAKKAMTIKPKDFTINTNQELPSPIVEYSGLVTGEQGDTVVNYSESPVMEIQDGSGSPLSNSSSNGSFPIVFTNNPTITSDNYSILTANGTLTIKSASGSSSGTSTPSTSTITVTTEESGNLKTNTTVIDSATSEGTASADVSSAIIDALLGKAAVTGGTSKGDIIEISVDTQGKVEKIEVSVPQNGLERIASETHSSLAITSPFVSITFDSKALETISDANNGGNVVISAGIVDSSKLTEEDRAKVQGRTVYDLTVISGNKQVSDFNGGHAIVNIPYILKPGENPNAVVVYYLADDSSLKPVRGHYDADTNAVVLKTIHFSRFVISYSPVFFNDVAATDWYKDAVEFIAARGITSGTGENKFSPESKLTRGQFIVFLLNSYQIDPIRVSHDHIGNFADAGNTYYTDYLATARSLGITNGVGNNMFAPEKEITRQEMFVLLFNALKVTEELPTATGRKQLENFNDADQVAFWANEALSALVKGGIVDGSNNMVSPTATTSRAEMAQVLYNLLAN